MQLTAHHPGDTTCDAEFDLDLRIVTDVEPGAGAAPCGTNDGCAPTCASSCTSNA
jgi:FxLD family lantipeptide